MTWKSGRTPRSPSAVEEMTLRSSQWKHKMLDDAEALEFVETAFEHDWRALEKLLVRLAQDGDDFLLGLT